ncbi:MAG: hypothetical protein JNK82_08165 [Myxococcaceae bacterium]|nr:hypothetical protein [Myxococcaceae bacterium]
MKRLRVLVLLAGAAACGRIAQSPECSKYMDCAIALDPFVTRQVNGQYGRTGTCWATTQQTADTCTMVCVRELAELRANADGGMTAPECQP